MIVQKTEEQKEFDKLIYRLYGEYMANPDFICIVYTAISKNSFNEIFDIKGFVESCIIDSVYIRGLNSHDETQVYSWDKPIMRITEHNINLTVKGKKIKINRK